MYIESNHLDRVFKRIRKATVRQLIFDNNDYRQTVFLAGTGRSGTTWVADIINYANDYRLMFEPFYSEEVDILSHFRYKQYLRPDNCDPDFLEPAKAILSGQVRSNWIDSVNRTVFARKRLIKDIRAHHLLKWIKTNFPEIPIILLLRHPCAVAHSKLKLDWDTHLDVFLSQDELVDDFLRPFRAEIEAARTTFEKHIFMWCIENYVPLKQFKTGEVQLAFYEYFCTEPENAVDRLFTFLGEAYDERVFDAVRKPSSLSREESAVITGEDLTRSWVRHFTEEQIQSAVKILSLFGLETIYSSDPMPLVDGEQIRL
jgi:hypothetical protein